MWRSFDDLFKNGAKVVWLVLLVVVVRLKMKRAIERECCRKFYIRLATNFIQVHRLLGVEFLGEFFIPESSSIVMPIGEPS